LRNRPAIDDYLQRRAEEAAVLRRTIESSQPSRSNLRARLLARQITKKTAVHLSPTVSVPEILSLLPVAEVLAQRNIEVLDAR
jgi:hypothetical protein